MQNCFLHRGVFCQWPVFTGQERLRPVCGMDLYALPSGAACSIHLAVMIVEYLAARRQVKRFQRAEDLLVQVHDLVERPLGGRALVHGLNVLIVQRHARLKQRGEQGGAALVDDDLVKQEIQWCECLAACCGAHAPDDGGQLPDGGGVFRFDNGAGGLDLDTLLAESDVVSIHMNLTPENYHMFNKETFLKMKKQPILINEGRGPMVSEDDLAWALDNVILNPHSGFLSDTSNYLVCTLPVQNAVAYVRGEPLPNGAVRNGVSL